MKSKEMCEVCGKEEAVCMGMCRKCYNRQRYRQKAGIPVFLPVGYRTQSADKKHIWCMYNAGMTMQEIGDNLGISKQRVSIILKKYKSENI